MRRRDALTRIGTLGALAILPPTTELPRRRSDGDQAQAVDLDRTLRLASVPSFALAEVDKDGVTTFAAGVRRAGETDPVSADTVYAAASLTKAVFAYAFIGLAMEGAISLDRPVGEYLPLPNPDDVAARAITARHLLSHSGGWRNWRNTVSQPLVAEFTPGERWSYSGEGYFFLQRVLEKVTGRGVGDVVRERVLAPLGMTRSSMVALEALEVNQAGPHNSRGEPGPVYGRPTLLELRRMMRAAGRTLESATVADVEAAMIAAEPQLPVLPNYMSPNAAASLQTTASDFGRFLRHLVTARRGGGTPAAIVAEMTSPQVRCNEAIQWGQGAGLETFDGATWAWQWGDNPGFKNIYFADPVRERALVVLTNGDRGARVYERVVRARTGLDHPAFLFA